jgi:hypothetical protein
LNYKKLRFPKTAIWNLCSKICPKSGRYCRLDFGQIVEKIERTA